MRALWPFVVVVVWRRRRRCARGFIACVPGRNGGIHRDRKNESLMQFDGSIFVRVPLRPPNRDREADIRIASALRFSIFHCSQHSTADNIIHLHPPAPLRSRMCVTIARARVDSTHALILTHTLCCSIAESINQNTITCVRARWHIRICSPYETYFSTQFN